MQTKSCFHLGELAVQKRSEEEAIADRNGSVIADTILGGARPFIQKQFMVVLASVDSNGAVWSSVLYGQPGFVMAESDVVIKFNIPEDKRDETDPFWTNISVNPSIGILFIELGTRRRYRINGMLKSNDNLGIDIEVREAYPNCPKYIQRRHLREFGMEPVNAELSRGHTVDNEIESLIHNSDTMFVASYYSGTGADASHRGGNHGFIQIIDDRTLRIPDYPGNSLFNTFGNIELDSRTGLCIPNFSSKNLLQLTGKSKILWNQDDPLNLTGGTSRFWEFAVESWILRSVPQRLEWEYLDASPFNLPILGGLI